MVTSTEYKNSLNAVLNSKYERLTHLKKVYEGFSFSRSKHNRYHEGDADSLAMLIKQDLKGALTFESVIDCNSSAFLPARAYLLAYDTKKFYQVSNSNTKSNYIIVDDVKDIVIYNINQKKIARTVPHKDGQVRTNIFPAKEGYVMVSEYNRKEKYTRLSIEAL